MPFRHVTISKQNSEPAGIRTPDPLLKREMLLPTELPVHKMAVPPELEPGLTESESVVLPITPRDQDGGVNGDRTRDL